MVIQPLPAWLDTNTRSTTAGAGTTHPSTLIYHSNQLLAMVVGGVEMDGWMDQRSYKWLLLVMRGDVLA